MHRIANPCRSVRLRPAPPEKFKLTLSSFKKTSQALYNLSLANAGIAQLVERNLAKVEVASSSLVSRSKH
jgi:hypothetical protein